MLKHSVAGLLLLAALPFPAAAAAAIPPGSSRWEAEVPGTETPGSNDVRSVTLPHRGGVEDLAGAVMLTVFFRTDSRNLDPEVLTSLRLLGALLREFPRLRVYLDAHSDQRGSNAHNRRLSRARADIIAGVFQDAGIPAQRIQGNAWGETQARAATDDTEGRVFDRRVDIQLGLDPET